MDDDGKNVEMIGHMNIGMALHPVVLKDGRVLVFTYSRQGDAITMLMQVYDANLKNPTTAMRYEATNQR